jgi:large subunit ribosomal protein L2
MFKKLTIGLKKSYGRNGKLICLTKGRTVLKIRYRFIDFYLNLLFDNIYVYLKYVYDPCRNSRLILCLTISGFFFYIIGPNKQKLPSFFNYIHLKNSNTLKYGQVSKLLKLSEGDFVFNISFYKAYYGQLCRSAGKYAQIIKLFFFSKYSLLRLKNGKKIIVENTNNILLGQVNNDFFYNILIGKAGINVNKGFKSKVRGVARNPIDHPNGGRTPGGKVYRSFAFKIARSRKKTSTLRNRYIHETF